MGTNSKTSHSTRRKPPCLYVFSPTNWFSLPPWCLTDSTVVVAWPDKLCFHVCRRQNLHRLGPSPSHRRKGAYDPSMGRHRSINRRWPRVLVCVDPAVPSRRLFLETSGAWSLWHRDMFGCRCPHRRRLSLQCRCNGLRFHPGSSAYRAGVELADDPQDKGCPGWYPELRMHVSLYSAPGNPDGLPVADSLGCLVRARPSLSVYPTFIATKTPSFSVSLLAEPSAPYEKHYHLIIPI